MFFIMGVSQGSKKLDFDQVICCNNCGRYGHLEVYMIYSYLSLFFIPLFKWGRRYIVTASCCQAQAELDFETGRGIELGEIRRLPEDIIPAVSYGGSYSGGGTYDTSRGGQTDSPGYTGAKKICARCGYETREDFDYCPKCGGKL